MIKKLTSNLLSTILTVLLFVGAVAPYNVKPVNAQDDWSSQLFVEEFEFCQNLCTPTSWKWLKLYCMSYDNLFKLKYEKEV